MPAAGSVRTVICFAVAALVLLFAVWFRWQLNRSEAAERLRVTDLAAHVDNFSAAAVAEGYPAIRPGQDAIEYVTDIESRSIEQGFTDVFG